MRNSLHGHRGYESGVVDVVTDDLLRHDELTPDGILTGVIRNTAKSRSIAFSRFAEYSTDQPNPPRAVPGLVLTLQYSAAFCGKKQT